MAKKRVSQSQSQQDKSSLKPEEFVKAPKEVTPSMDSESSEKLESLKSLNQMLVKETFERRQQVESLVQSKGCLESDLARSKSEKESLSSELTRLAERAAMLELERTVVAVFVGVQLGLKGEAIEQKLSELEKVIGEKEAAIGRLTGKLTVTEGLLGNEKEVSKSLRFERDEVKHKLDLQIGEGLGMKANLVESEEKRGAIERELGELKAEYKDVEMRFRTVTREKETIERGLVESEKSIEEMKEKLCAAVKEKERVDEEKAEETVRREELEGAVSRLSETVVSLQKEELKLRGVVSELEKKWFEGEERRKEMEREIDELIEEKNLSEKKIEGLSGEKIAIERDLSEALKRVAEEKVKFEGMVNENSVMVKAKGELEAVVLKLKEKIKCLESEVVEFEKVKIAMEREIDELIEEKNLSDKKIEGLSGEKIAIERDLSEAMKRVAEEKVKLEGMINENSVIVKAKGELEAVVLKLEEKIEGLESEVVEFEKVKIVKDQMRISLDEEKKNVVRLKEMIGDLESKISEKVKVCEKIKAEKGVMFAEKVELESQREVLKKEIGSLENTISEAHRELDLVKGKVGKADANAGVVLSMLKGTAAFCADVGAGEFVGNGEGTDVYVVELEMIKNSFKDKESKIENMKRQLEVLKGSVEDAHKKKSFWTVLSSATTLLAAVSLAYVARGH